MRIGTEGNEENEDNAQQTIITGKETNDDRTDCPGDIQRLRLTVVLYQAVSSLRKTPAQIRRSTASANSKINAFSE